MTQKIVYVDLPYDSGIILGRLGENETHQVIFDYSEWADMFGEGIATVSVTKPITGEEYQPEVTNSDNCAIWVITSDDLENIGKGKCQVIYTNGIKVKKSQIYKTLIYDALPTA